MLFRILEIVDLEEDRIKRELDRAYYCGPHTDVQLLRLEEIPRWVIFSDHHKGTGDDADDFRDCEKAYHAALGYYLAAGFNLVVLGDAEELWENRVRPVIKRYSATLQLEAEFHKKGRYWRIWGNHDSEWEDQRSVKKHLGCFFGGFLFSVGLTFKIELDEGVLSEELRQEFEGQGFPLSENVDLATKVAGSRWRIDDQGKTYIVIGEGESLNIYFGDIRVWEGLCLDIRDRGKKLGQIFLVHGHQGGLLTDRFGQLVRIAFRYIVRNYQRLTKAKVSTPATHWRLRFGHNIAMYNWAAEKEEPLVLIAGHTHRPVFRSRDYLSKLAEELEQLKELGYLAQSIEKRAQLEYERAQENRLTEEILLFSVGLTSKRKLVRHLTRLLPFLRRKQRQISYQMTHLEQGALSEELQQEFKCQGFPIDGFVVEPEVPGSRWRVDGQGKTYIVIREDEALKIYEEIGGGNQKPCYFNSGCCSFADGDVTGIEIFGGEIRLVRWPNDEGDPKRKILDRADLREVLEQAAGSAPSLSFPQKDWFSV